MKRQFIECNTQIQTTGFLTGESIEEKMRRVTETNESIKDDGAPLYYTERKDGVMPEFDIRTDRFEIAQDACDKIQKSVIAKREERLKETSKKTETIETKTE